MSGKKKNRNVTNIYSPITISFHRFYYNRLELEKNNDIDHWFCRSERQHSFIGAASLRGISANRYSGTDMFGGPILLATLDNIDCVTIKAMLSEGLI